MNTKKVTTILITLIVIEFSIIGIFIKDYKNSWQYNHKWV